MDEYTKYSSFSLKTWILVATILAINIRLVFVLDLPREVDLPETLACYQVIKFLKEYPIF